MRVENPMVNDKAWGWSKWNLKDLEFEEIEEMSTCCMCKKPGETESEIFEDTFLCESKECFNLHYTNWAESLELQKFFRKEKSIHRAMDTF